MALGSFSSSPRLSPVTSSYRNPRVSLCNLHVLGSFVSCPNGFRKSYVCMLAGSAPKAPKARFIARRRESVLIQQLQRSLSEYVSLPASQYSVLDAERIERVDDNTFRCYVYRFVFFALEVCPVLLVRVEQEPNGCSIKLLSCKLEGSPVVVAQNKKFDASMVNQISCSGGQSNSRAQQLTSDAVIEVSIDIPLAFRAFPVQMIESTGTQVLEQILRVMLPRFMAQLVKDYKAWASGDTSRQPLGTGEI
ncbi:uncharacterized protein LOC131165342 isoform X4 [Malania oleifera]|uniref:uncharacterized protein LOC131165342 isoform X4 n=1 Tax=Malania oleifera TaxID=397392 RepID=UPI0025ADBEFF|nr:uncharacterized protein LOC131165342 isoform X4 [Malania oleifera]